MKRIGPAVLAAVVLTAGGCSTYIEGRPVAVPGQAGVGVAPADLLTTTCREYIAMDDATRRKVINAIADDGNELVGINPDLWVGVAGALCTFVDPSAPVRDVVIGQGPR